MSALLQATGVAFANPGTARGLLIVGPPGSGKSSLALALIDRGATLIGDDGVRLETRADRLWALPPPHIDGLLEIRNVGILTFPVTTAAVALVVRLDAEAPRYLERAEEIVLADVPVPLVRLWPGASTLPLRAEWALKVHGFVAPGGTA